MAEGNIEVLERKYVALIEQLDSIDKGYIGLDGGKIIAHEGVLYVELLNRKVPLKQYCDQSSYNYEQKLNQWIRGAEGDINHYVNQKFLEILKEGKFIKLKDSDGFGVTMKKGVVVGDFGGQEIRLEVFLDMLGLDKVELLGRVEGSLKEANSREISKLEAKLVELMEEKNEALFFRDGEIDIDYDNEKKLHFVCDMESLSLEGYCKEKGSDYKDVLTDLISSVRRAVPVKEGGGNRAYLEKALAGLVKGKPLTINDFYSVIFEDGKLAYSLKKGKGSLVKDLEKSNLLLSFLLTNVDNASYEEILEELIKRAHKRDREAKSSVVVGADNQKKTVSSQREGARKVFERRPEEVVEGFGADFLRNVAGLFDLRARDLAFFDGNVTYCRFSDDFAKCSIFERKEDSNIVKDLEVDRMSLRDRRAVKKAVRDWLRERFCLKKNEVDVVFARLLEAKLDKEEIPSILLKDRLNLDNSQLDDMYNYLQSAEFNKETIAGLVDFCNENGVEGNLYQCEKGGVWLKNDQGKVLGRVSEGNCELGGFAQAVLQEVVKMYACLLNAPTLVNVKGVEAEKSVLSAENELEKKLIEGLKNGAIKTDNAKVFLNKEGDLCCEILFEEGYSEVGFLKDNFAAVGSNLGCDTYKEVLEFLVEMAPSRPVSPSGAEKLRDVYLERQ